MKSVCDLFVMTAFSTSRFSLLRLLFHSLLQILILKILWFNFSSCGKKAKFHSLSNQNKLTRFSHSRYCFNLVIFQIVSNVLLFFVINFTIYVNLVPFFAVSVVCNALVPYSSPKERDIVKLLSFPEHS